MSDCAAALTIRAADGGVRARYNPAVAEPHGKLTSAKIAELVKVQFRLTKAEAGAVVKTVLDGISGALAEGDSVKLRGFGTFGTRQQGRRTFRNPRTGESVEVGARRRPFFRPAQALRRAVTESNLPKE